MTAFHCRQCGRDLEISCCSSCGGALATQPVPLEEVFGDWELRIAAEIRAGVLHQGTVLAVLSLLRDSVRGAGDPALAERLLPTACEAAEVRTALSQLDAEERHG